MNPSYGDSTNSAQGRARVPGSGGGYDDQDQGYDDPYDPYGPPTRGVSASAGRASVGTGSVPSGRASVSGAAGRAGVGRASVGRAVVGDRPDVLTGPGGDDLGHGGP